MAWETDRHGRTRYVKKTRVGQRVTSKVLHGDEEVRRAQEAIKRRREIQSQRQREELEIQTKFAMYDRKVKEVVALYFLSQGLIKRKSVWQRISCLNSPLTEREQALIERTNMPTSRRQSPIELPMLEKLLSFGDAELDNEQKIEVREILKKDPDLWRALGDVASWCREACLMAVTKQNAQNECVVFGMNQMRRNLIQEGDSEIERILVEQIVTCWLQVGTTACQLQALQVCEENMSEIRRLERRYNQDHARLNRSIAGLSRVRRTIFENQLSLKRIESRELKMIEENSRKEAFRQLKNAQPSAEKVLDSQKPNADAPTRRQTTSPKKSRRRWRNKRLNSQEFATSIPTSNDISIVSPKVEDFIHRSDAMHAQNWDWEANSETFEANLN